MDQNRAKKEKTIIFTTEQNIHSMAKSLAGKNCGNIFTTMRIVLKISENLLSSNSENSSSITRHQKIKMENNKAKKEKA